MERHEQRGKQRAICRHGILGRRSSLEREVSTKDGDKSGRVKRQRTVGEKAVRYDESETYVCPSSRTREEEERRARRKGTSLEIGVSADFKRRNVQGNELIRYNAAERVVPHWWMSRVVTKKWMAFLLSVLSL